MCFVYPLNENKIIIALQRLTICVNLYTIGIYKRGTY